MTDTNIKRPASIYLTQELIADAAFSLEEMTAQLRGRDAPTPHVEYRELCAPEVPPCKSLADVIETLQAAKQEHYGERSGLDSCPAGSTYYPGPCDCGAVEINARVDAAIVYLRRLEVTLDAVG